MHTEQNATFLQLFPHKHPLPPNPTTTHEFIGAYFIQIPPPLGDPALPHSNEVLKSIEK